MQRYRVECNYGSRYFKNAAEAFAFYRKKQTQNLDVEIWLVNYCYLEVEKRFSAEQELLEYTSSNMPK